MAVSSTIRHDAPSDAGDFDLFTTLRFDPRFMHDVEADSGHSSNDERLKECLWLWPLHQQRLRDGLRASGWEQAREGIALHSVEPGFLESVLQGISHHYGLDSTDYARWTQREWQQILDQGPLRIKLLVAKDRRLRTEVFSTTSLPLLQFPRASAAQSPFKETTVPNGDDLPPIYLDTKLSQLSFVTRYKTTARSMYDSARLRAALTNYTTPGEVLLVNEADNVMDGSITTLYLYRDGGWKTPSTESGSQVGVTRRLALEKEWCSEGEITVSTLECGEVIWASNALKGYFPMRFDGYR